MKKKNLISFFIQNWFLCPFLVWRAAAVALWRARSGHNPAEAGAWERVLGGGLRVRGPPALCPPRATRALPRNTASTTLCAHYRATLYAHCTPGAPGPRHQGTTTDLISWSPCHHRGCYLCNKVTGWRALLNMATSKCSNLQCFYFCFKQKIGRLSGWGVWWGWCAAPLVPTIASGPCRPANLLPTDM